MLEQELIARLRTNKGKADVLLEIINGLVEINLTLLELLRIKGIASEDEIHAALSSAAPASKGGMAEFIIDGTLEGFEDGDTRLIRMAQYVRHLRQRQKPQARAEDPRS